MATSASGSGLAEQGGIEPLDISINVSLDVLENPKTQPKLEIPENSDSAPSLPTTKINQVKFSATRDKFLQFKQDIQNAVNLMQITSKIAQE